MGRESFSNEQSPQCFISETETRVRPSCDLSRPFRLKEEWEAMYVKAVRPPVSLLSSPFRELFPTFTHRLFLSFSPPKENLEVLPDQSSCLLVLSKCGNEPRLWLNQKGLHQLDGFYSGHSNSHSLHQQVLLWRFLPRREATRAASGSASDLAGGSSGQRLCRMQNPGSAAVCPEIIYRLIPLTLHSISLTLRRQYLVGFEERQAFLGEYTVWGEGRECG